MPNGTGYLWSDDNLSNDYYWAHLDIPGKPYILVKTTQSCWLQWSLLAIRQSEIYGRSPMQVLITSPVAGRVAVKSCRQSRISLIKLHLLYLVAASGLEPLTPGL